LQEAPIFERDISLEDVNPLEFFGVNNQKFDLIQSAFPEVRCVARGNVVKTYGEPAKLAALSRLIGAVLNEIQLSGSIATERLRDLIRSGQALAAAHPPTKAPHPEAPAPADLYHDADPPLLPPANPMDEYIVRSVGGTPIRARNHGQRQIVELARENDIVLAMGPAGSGKTYLAVALAVQALKEKRVRKIILTRPAVEAGERLGFLPGDLKEKIDPYLRPLYDALEDMIHPEKLKAYLERNIIEIAPLAYMRGRTLNQAFIILDEAQNATEMQLKMFLTRMGTDSQIIVTGDLTQVDLPSSQRSGLRQTRRILQGIPGIGIVELAESDVVRHPLVRRIIRAYEHDEDRRKELQEQARREKEAQQAQPTTAPAPDLG